MGLIRYSCGHISGHNKPIHAIWYVRVFHHVLLKYCHDENAEMHKRKFDDVTLQYSMLFIIIPDQSCAKSSTPNPTMHLATNLSF